MRLGPLAPRGLRFSVRPGQAAGSGAMELGRRARFRQNPANKSQILVLFDGWPPPHRQRRRTSCVFGESSVFLGRNGCKTKMLLVCLYKKRHLYAQRLQSNAFGPLQGSRQQQDCLLYQYATPAQRGIPTEKQGKEDLSCNPLSSVFRTERGSHPGRCGPGGLSRPPGPAGP